MRGINKAIIVGTLGADPDVRYTPSQVAVANLSVATNEVWTDKESGERKEKTEWHRVSVFGRTAEVAGEYLRKGRQVYIEGRIQTRKWKDKDGHDRYTTEVVADTMQMLGGKDDGDRSYGDRTPAHPPGQSSRPQSGPGERPHGTAPDTDFDDDIPF